MGKRCHSGKVASSIFNEVSRNSHKTILWVWKEAHNTVAKPIARSVGSPWFIRHRIKQCEHETCRNQQKRRFALHNSIGFSLNHIFAANFYPLLALIPMTPSCNETTVQITEKRMI